eukprot:Phypoly_transcript_01812.p1 GENE.Phypoly_transcript_01812~~Phypoly_transcript_01812.p1  ORF type:complete len:511 (+),score=114.30 Phypoly_transcript_01812:1499-3031(+)
MVTSNDYHIGNSQVGWVKVEFLQGYVSYRRTECTFWIQWWQLWFDPKGKFHSELLPVGDATCAVYSPLTFPLPVDSAAIAIHPVSNVTSQKGNFCPNATHTGLVLLSSHKNIHGGVLCVNTQTNVVRVCTDSSCTLTQEQLQESGSNRYPTLPALDVGTFPSLSLASLSSGETVVLEVHGDGYCYNSDWNNKRAYPSVCESVPVSSRYVLNYNYGKLQDWATHIFEKRGMISSCDGSIFHGAYDEGSLPTAFLMTDQNDEMRMIEAHTGFPSGAVDYAGCSWPIPYDGAMIDGIVLPSLVLMQGGKWEPSTEIMKLVTPKDNYDNNVYSPSGQVTIASSICDLCKARFFAWQTTYQSDYELMHSLARMVSDMCTVGQILVGDGTVAGCKNLVLLYFPALAVDLAHSIFSPDNCQLIGVCAGNATGVLPDINKQVSRSEIPPPPTEEFARAARSIAEAADAEDEDAEDAEAGFVWSAEDAAAITREAEAQQEIMRILRNAVKTRLLELVGL